VIGLYKSIDDETFFLN